MAEIEIRQARPEDRDAVLAFCQNTWEWGDYIEYVWDEWLHDPTGELLVATIDGQPVGVSHFRLLNATEAWFEGMRIDPVHRQQGLASALNDTMMAEAKKRGATVARLITESTNTGAIRTIENGHMRQVGAFAPYRYVGEAFAGALRTPPKRLQGLETPQLATGADIDEILSFLNASNILPVVGGLYYISWTAYSITPALLEEKVQAGHVYLLRRWDRLDGLAIAEPREGRQESYLSIGYIDGTTADTIGLIAYALRRIGSEMELESVYAHVPDMIMVRDAFVGAEYEWDGKVFYAYERRLM